MGISAEHPYKYRVFYEYLDEDKPRIFPADGEERVNEPSNTPATKGATSGEESVNEPSNTPATKGATSGVDRLESTLEHVPLPEWKKEYIRDQVHSRLCALTADLLEVMPEDPT